MAFQQVLANYLDLFMSMSVLTLFGLAGATGVACYVVWDFVNDYMRTRALLNMVSNVADNDDYFDVVTSYRDEIPNS